MIGALDVTGTLGAAMVIVALPALIIGVGEFEERLRQRDSDLRATVSIVRIWVVPLLAVWTLTRTLFDTDPDNLAIRLLDSAVVIAVVAALLAALRVVVGRLVDRPRRDGQRSVPRLLLAVPRLAVVLVAAWMLVAVVWGVDLSAALTALGVTSLVISFALQDTLGGIASGFTLLADQPFSAGDWIETDDIEGRVVDVNWRSTRILDRNGDLVIVPNGALSKATIVNFDQPSRLHRVMVPVQIERTAPPTAAKAMLVDAARSTPGVLEHPAPFAFVTNIADPIVDYQAYMWVADYSIVPQVKADFGSLVWYLSYRHDVPLPNPAQDIYIFDGVQTALGREVSVAERRRAIIGSPMLSDIGDDAVDQLAAGSAVASYQEGETIVTEGRQRDLFVLDRGRAELVLRRSGDADLHVFDLSPGELFGISNELTDSARDAVVVARTDCRVVRVPADSISAAMAMSGDLGPALEQLATSRRRRSERVLRRVERERSADVARDSASPTPPGETP